MNNNKYPFNFSLFIFLCIYKGNMPLAFEKCLQAPNHRVRTIKPNQNTYIHICYSNGVASHGEIKHLKNLLNKKNVSLWYI